jgi:hypothetical protein
MVNWSGDIGSRAPARWAASAPAGVAGSATVTGAAGRDVPDPIDARDRCSDSGGDA